MRSVEFVGLRAFEHTTVCVPFLGVNKHCLLSALCKQGERFEGEHVHGHNHMAFANACGVGLFTSFFTLHGYERDHARLKGV